MCHICVRESKKEYFLVNALNKNPVKNNRRCNFSWRRIKWEDANLQTTENEAACETIDDRKNVSSEKNIANDITAEIAPYVK